jgi:organic radical activating enzyme
VDTNLIANDRSADCFPIAIESPDRYLSITWQVNNFCNYSCSYCNPGNWQGDNRNLEPVEVYIKNLDSIIEKYHDLGYRNYKFFFSGGEPTAWVNFIPLVTHIRQKLPESTIAVNTNLSRPLEWWKKHYHLFDDIVASFHVEFADKQAYKEKNIFLCDKVNYLSTKLLLHDDRFWEIVEFGEELKKEMPNYFLEWTPLYDEMTVNASPWQYNDVEKERFIEEHSTESKFTVQKPYRINKAISYTVYNNGTKEFCNSNDIIVRRQNFFTGWDCDVGDSIFISPNRNVSLASCGVVSVVGNILTDVSNVGPKTVVCNKKHCHCGTDIIIPKRKPVN